MDNRVGILISDGNFNEAIKNGFMFYNSIDFQKMSADKKGIFLYDLSLAYKKKNMFEQSLKTCQESEKYLLKSNNEDFLGRIKWLINENYIELKIDDGLIVDRYIYCKDYYQKVEEQLMFCMVGFNIGLYTKNEYELQLYFSKMIKYYKFKLKAVKNYNINGMLKEAIEDSKKVSLEISEELKTYLFNEMSISI